VTASISYDLGIIMARIGYHMWWREESMKDWLEGHGEMSAAKRQKAAQRGTSQSGYNAG
jgi:hypothetical protein